MSILKWKWNNFTKTLFDIIKLLYNILFVYHVIILASMLILKFHWIWYCMLNAPKKDTWMQRATFNASTRAFKKILVMPRTKNIITSQRTPLFLSHIISLFLWVIFRHYHPIFLRHHNSVLSILCLVMNWNSLDKVLSLWELYCEITAASFLS